MEQNKIEFRSLNLVVDNLDESIYFYKRVGFYVDDIDQTDEYLSADIKLSEKSNFVIRLMQYFGNGNSMPKVTISLTANKEAGVTHTIVFEELLMRGVRFLGLCSHELSGTILSIGEISDPDGHKLEL